VVSQPGFASPHPLDNPIWHALSTVHRPLARGNDLAKLYPSEIAPLSAIPEQTPEAYTALGDTLGPDDTAALFLNEMPRVPPNFAVTTTFEIDQMVCETAPASGRDDYEQFGLEELSENDVPQMLALTKLTEPGPFRRRTIEFGGYTGIFTADRKLAAMAGQRLRLPGFTEVSAVCTHPDHRGKGYARAVMLAVISGISRRGEVPILHVKSDNSGAIRLYETLGFTFRRYFNLVVARKAS